MARFWRLGILWLFACSFVATQAGFLDNLINRVRGGIGGNSSSRNKPGCNCPCRDFWVTKCVFTAVKEECKPGYSSKSCQQLPVVESKRVKVTECQRCQRFYQEVLDVTTVRRCAPVYDERCRTKYPRQCFTQRQCTDVYVTECKDGKGHGQNGGKYQQKCQQVPKETCVDIVKCHRTPKTKCTPVTKQNCKRVPLPVKKNQMQHRCLPFENQKKDTSQDCSKVTPAQLLLSGDQSAVPAIVPQVVVSPGNALRLKLSGIGEDEVRQSVIEQQGLQEIAALTDDGRNPAGLVSALAPQIAQQQIREQLANGGLAALLQQQQNGGISQQQISQLLGSGGSGGISQQQINQLLQQNGGTGGISQQQINQLLQQSGGGTGGISQQQINQVLQQNGGSGAEGISQQQINQFLQQNGGGAGGISQQQINQFLQQNGGSGGGGGLSQAQVNQFLQQNGGIAGGSINQAQIDQFLEQNSGGVGDSSRQPNRPSTHDNKPMVPIVQAVANPSSPLTTTPPPGLNLPPGVTLPPGLNLPAGVTLPPGLNLPAGVTLPPGLNLPPGFQIPDGIDLASLPPDIRDNLFGPAKRQVRPPPLAEDDFKPSQRLLDGDRHGRLSLALEQTTRSALEADNVEMDEEKKGKRPSKSRERPIQPINSSTSTSTSTTKESTTTTTTTTTSFSTSTDKQDGMRDKKTVNFKGNENDPKPNEKAPRNRQPKSLAKNFEDSAAGTEDNQSLSEQDERLIRLIVESSREVSQTDYNDEHGLQGEDATKDVEVDDDADDAGENSEKNKEKSKSNDKRKRKKRRKKKQEQE